MKADINRAAARASVLGVKVLIMFRGLGKLHTPCMHQFRQYNTKPTLHHPGVKCRIVAASHDEFVCTAPEEIMIFRKHK